MRSRARGILGYAVRLPSPGPLLGAFVDYFWLLSDAPSHARQRILLGRVELKLGGHVLRAGQSLRLLVAEDGVSWRRVSALRGRPPVEEQAAGGRSHVMIVGSVRACGVRIEQVDRAKARWAVAELRLDALDAPALASLRCPGGR